MMMNMIAPLCLLVLQEVLKCQVNLCCVSQTLPAVSEAMKVEVLLPAGEATNARASSGEQTPVARYTVEDMKTEVLLLEEKVWKVQGSPKEQIPVGPCTFVLMEIITL